MNAREEKAPQVPSPGTLLTGWARQGVQSFVAAQKIARDLVAQENALLFGMVREGLNNKAFRPDISMVGIAETGAKNLTKAGKVLLDFAARETTVAVDGVKQGLRLSVVAGVMPEVVRHRVDTLIEMQKDLLDVTAEQAHAVAESYRQGNGMLAAVNVVELLRRGIEGFVESEKKFLGLAAQEVSAATKGDKRTHKPPREPMEVLRKVVREGAEKYIEMQKELLELAIEQIEATMKAGSNHTAAPKGARSLLGEVAEKSVKNFVTTEKSLLDLAMKPMARPGRGEGRKVRRPRTRTHHAAKKEAAGKVN